MTTYWTRNCACGVPVTAAIDDPAPGVAAHNATPAHQDYRSRTSWLPRPSQPDPTAGPAPRDVSAALPVRPVRRRWPRGRVAAR